MTARPARPPALGSGAHTSNGEPELVESIVRRVVEHEREAIARRVVELLREEPPAPAGLVDAATVAQALGVERDWVYRHADALGARRFGDGAKPMLRFDLAEAREAGERVASCSGSRRSAKAAKRGAERKPRGRQAPRTGTTTDALPIGRKGRADRAAE